MNNNLIDTELTEQQAHENFCSYYDSIIAKRYLMTEVEYFQYRNEVLAKTNSGNIHDIKGILGVIQKFIEIANLYPEKVNRAVEVILKAKGRIYELTKTTI